MARARSPLGSTWLLGVLVGLLSWPDRLVSPTIGIDVSWQLSLQMAAHADLGFGTEYVLNGGPLEFVLHPTVAYPVTAVVGALYVFATQVALGVTLVWVLRRSFPLGVAALLAYLFLALDADQFVPAPQPLLVLAFLWGIASLDDEAPPFVAPLVVFGGAFVSALAMLVQFSDGFLILFICLVVVAVQRRQWPRSLPLFACTFALSLGALWLASGQGIGNVGPFLRTTADVLGQWSVVFPYEGPAVTWLLPYMLGALIASFLATWLGTRGLSKARRVAVFVVVAAVGFSAWKHAVVIDFPPYAALFGSLMILPWLAFRWSGATRGLAMTATALLGALFFPLSDSSVDTLLHPLARARDAERQLTTLVLPDHREQARDEAVRGLRASYRVDRKTLSLLRGRPVLAYPWETALPWAYDLDWRLLPTPPYMGYAQSLDRLDAEAIESPTGPQAILRHRPCGATATPPFTECRPWEAFGPTYLPHEIPRATLAILCNFEAVHTTPRFQVLFRVPNRCGPARRISSTTVSDLEPARVPTPPHPNEIVIAKVHGFEPEGLERVRSFLYRAAMRFERFNGKALFRVVPGTMTAGVLLGIPPHVDFSTPFPLAINVHRVEFHTEPALGVGDREYKIEYFGVPVRATARDPVAARVHRG